MKRYVIQRRARDWDPWEVCERCQYDTLEEARAAFDKLPCKSNHRIAESYVQVRYKAVKGSIRP